VANTPASTKAKTVTEYMAATANWRTELYSGPTSGTLMTHSESIALFTKLGVKMTPELKSASVSMPFDGFSQEKTTRKK
jgi:glycerophosphoryl diester phosphodiesterase